MEKLQSESNMGIIFQLYMTYIATRSTYSIESYCVGNESQSKEHFDELTFHVGW